MDEDVTKDVRSRKRPEGSHVAPPPAAKPSAASAAASTPKPAPARAAENPDLYNTVRYQAPGEPIATAATKAEAAAAALPPSDPITGWLIIVKGLGRGRSLPLGYGIHSVGRADDQRIRLNFGDKRISRRHFSIAYDGKGRTFWVSASVGSTSLAHLNGQPILQMFQLKQGDRIAVGETELDFMPYCGPNFDWQES